MQIVTHLYNYTLLESTSSSSYLPRVPQSDYVILNKKHYASVQHKLIQRSVHLLWLGRLSLEILDITSCHTAIRLNFEIINRLQP